MPFIFAHRKRARCFRRKPSAHPQRPFWSHPGCAGHGGGHHLYSATH